MGVFLGLGRFLNLLSRPIRNPYTPLVLLLALSGILTILHGPGSLVGGVMLLWMAGMLRLQHSQRETLRIQVKLLQALEFSRQQYPLSSAERQWY